MSEEISRGVPGNFSIVHMNNLIEDAEKINREELTDQIAEMEVYRIQSYLGMLFANIYLGILRFLGIFIKSARRKATLMERKTFEILLEEKRDLLRRLCASEDSASGGRIGILLRESLDDHLIIPRIEKAGSDKVSAEITRKAANILDKKELKGRSVYEINEAIHRRYGEKDLHDYRRLLRSWLITSCLIFVFGVTLILFRYFMIKNAVQTYVSFGYFPAENHVQTYVNPEFFASQKAALLYSILSRISPLYICIAMFFCLMSAWVCFSRNLSVRHMARLVWLIVSETGGPVYGRNSLSFIDDEEMHLIRLRMRTLHTMLSSRDVTRREMDSISRQIDSLESTIEKNERIIAGDDSDRNKNNYTDSRSAADRDRIVSDKLNENRVLREKEAAAKQKLESRRQEYERYSQMTGTLKDYLIPYFLGKWESIYPGLRFEPEAADRIISSFSLEEMETVEKRFYELCNTRDPVAIADRKSRKKYAVEFLTDHGAVSEIVFRTGDDPGRVNILEVTRGDMLAEPFATEAELKAAIEGLHPEPEETATAYQEMIDDLKEWYSEESHKWESQKKQLLDANSRLKTEKNNLVGEIESKQLRINELAAQVEKKSEDCRKLQFLIDENKKKNDPEKERKLVATLAQYKKQLDELQSEYEGKQREIDELYSRIEDLGRRQQELYQTLSDKEKELSDMQEKLLKFDSLIHQKESEIQTLNGRIQDGDNQIVTLNGLLKKAEKAAGADKDTIRKLRNSKDKLESEKADMLSKIDGMTDEIRTLNDAKQQTDATIRDQQKSIEDLRKQMEENSSDILYNREIFDELDKWIDTAQKYIYIIAPFTYYRRINYMISKFKSALERQPELKIKILYGMKDTNEFGQIRKPEVIEEARKNIWKMEKELGKSLSTRETNTHDKVVIVDDEKFMLGSANVLSFSGNYRSERNLHHEIVIISHNKTQLEELKRKFFAW